MLVSTRAATSVEVLPSPTAFVCLRDFATSGAASQAFCRPVKQAETRFRIFYLRRFALGNHPDCIAGFLPKNVITRTDSIPVRDRLWQGDLVLGCNFGHRLLGGSPSLL